MSHWITLSLIFFVSLAAKADGKPTPPTAPVPAPAAPGVETGLKFNDKGEVNLPPEVTKAIAVLNQKQKSEGFKEYDFKTFKKSDFIESVQDLFERSETESPMAIQGDFNGDGKTDYILLGHANVSNDEPGQKPEVEQAQIHMAVISNPETPFYTAKEMRADPFVDPSKNEFPPESKDDKRSDEEVSKHPVQTGLYMHYLRRICAKDRETDPRCPDRKNGLNPAPKRCAQKANDGILLESYQNNDNVMLCYECDKNHKSCQLFEEGDDDDDAEAATKPSSAVK